MGTLRLELAAKDLDPFSNLPFNIEFRTKAPTRKRDTTQNSDKNSTWIEYCYIYY